MSFWIGVIIFITCLLINILITIVIVLRTSASQKIIKEIEQKASPIKNDLANHILLADDVVNQLKILLKEVEQNTSASKYSRKNHSQDKNPENHQEINSNDKGKEEKDITTLVQVLLEQGLSNQEIVELLHISYAEVEIIKRINTA